MDRASCVLVTISIERNGSRDVLEGFVYQRGGGAEFAEGRAEGVDTAGPPRLPPGAVGVGIGDTKLVKVRVQSVGFADEVNKGVIFAAQSP